MALRDAGVAPDEVDYIVAHGTSTPLNDVTETRAIKAAFGDHARHVAISSPKSMVGHLLGAAGVMSALTAIGAIRDNVVPPTINLSNPDLPECDLDYTPNVARQRRGWTPRSSTASASAARTRWPSSAASRRSAGRSVGPGLRAAIRRADDALGAATRLFISTRDSRL